jgi:hypothetical protein
VRLFDHLPSVVWDCPRTRGYSQSFSFHIVNIFQKPMLHDVELSVSKLGDPAGSRTRKNLTLAALEVQLETTGDVELCSKLKPLIKNFDAACKELRHRRKGGLPISI